MKLIRLLSYVCVINFFYPTLSYAVVLNIDNGTLKGATGVNVNGNLYDVSFQDGTCVDLFNGCNESSDFFFSVPDESLDTLVNSEAAKASQALLDQVFIDSNLGQFDSEQFLTFGCNNGNICSVVTPVFPISSSSLFHSINADNWFMEANDLTSIAYDTPKTSDSSPFLPNPGSDTRVYAMWSVTTVPIPAAVWLFSFGLVGLIGIRKQSSKIPALPA